VADDPPPDAHQALVKRLIFVGFDGQDAAITDG